MCASFDLGSPPLEADPDLSAGSLWDLSPPDRPDLTSPRFWDWAKCKNYRVLKAHDGVCSGALWPGRPCEEKRERGVSEETPLVGAV